MLRSEFHIESLDLSIIHHNGISWLSDQIFILSIIGNNRKRYNNLIVWWTFNLNIFYSSQICNFPVIWKKRSHKKERNIAAENWIPNVNDSSGRIDEYRIRMADYFSISSLHDHKRLSNFSPHRSKIRKKKNEERRIGEGGGEARGRR